MRKRGQLQSFAGIFFSLIGECVVAHAPPCRGLAGYDANEGSTSKKTIKHTGHRKLNRNWFNGSHDTNWYPCVWMRHLVRSREALYFRVIPMLATLSVSYHSHHVVKRHASSQPPRRAGNSSFMHIQMIAIFYLFYCLVVLVVTLHMVCRSSNFTFRNDYLLQWWRMQTD